MYTIVEYTDALNEEQTLVFDFGGKLEEAQRMMYSGMLAIKQKSPPIKLPEDNAAVTMSKPTEIINNSSDENPLCILQIRFAKVEISKEEYEEMRKMIDNFQY
jgi:hypothetical protein